MEAADAAAPGAFGSPPKPPPSAYPGRAAGESSSVAFSAPTSTLSSTSGGGSGLGAVNSTPTKVTADGGSSAPRGLKSSGSSMVSLQEAQEAEERQRQWLQQLSVGSCRDGGRDIGMKTYWDTGLRRLSNT